MINIFGLLLLCVAVVTAAPAAGTKGGEAQDIYDKCGTVGVVCHGTEADCVKTRTCNALVVYQTTGPDAHNFDLITINQNNKNIYASVIFSDDKVRNADMAVVCKKMAAFITPTVTAYKVLLTDAGEPGSPITDGTEFVVSTSTAKDGHVICSFTLKNSVPFDSQILTLDGTKEYYLITAYGPVDASGTIQPPTNEATSSRPYFKPREVADIYDKCKTTETVCVGKTTATPATDCTTTSGTCDVLLVYQPTTTKAGAVVHNFDLLTKQASAAYAALSFSQGGEIKGSPAVVCQTTTDAATDVKGTKFQVNTDGTKFDAVTDQTGLNVGVKKVVEDHVVCSFTLADSVVFNGGLTLSLLGDTSYFMFASYGTVTDVNGALSAIVDSAKSANSHFKTSEVDAIYTKCADTNKYVCVGTSTGNTDNTATCVAASNCKVLTVYEYSETDGKHIFDLITPESNGYAAVAFSDNEKMDADGGLLCQKTTDSKVDVKKIKLIDDSMTILSDTAGVKTDAANNVVKDGYIICKFTLDGSVDYRDVTISLLGLKQYYIFGAYGPVNENGEPQKHAGFVVSKNQQFRNLDRYTKTLYTGCNEADNEDVICVGTSATTKADSDCLTTTDCKVLTRYEYTADGKHIVNLLTTVEGSYAAVSFSTDDKRGDNDLAVVCRKEITRVTTVKIVKAIIGATIEELTTDTSGLIQNEAVENPGKGVVCSFELSKFVPFKPAENITLSLAGNEPYYLSTEYGTLKTDGTPDKPTAQGTTPDTKFERDESAIPANMYDTCSEDKVQCLGGYWEISSKADTASCVDTRDCSFLAVYIEPESGDEPTFQVFADRPSEYVAIGFSDDQKMGEDSMVVCIPGLPDGQNKTIKAFTSKEAPYTVVLDTTVSELASPNATNYGSLIYCEFSMERSNQYKNKIITLARTEEYYLLLAAGPVIKDTSGKITGIDSHTGTAVSGEKWFKSSATSFMATSVISYIILIFIVSLFK